jgi:plasmid stability protein
MKRTLVQFDEETYRKLRQQAFRQERSVSSLVREMVAKGLEGDAGRKRPTRVNQFSSVRAGRSKQGRLSPVSEKHDQALAAAFEK